MNQFKTIRIKQEINLSKSIDESVIKELINQLYKNIMSNQDIMFSTNQVFHYDSTTNNYIVNNQYVATIKDESFLKENYQSLFNEMLFISKEIQNKLIEYDYLKAIETTTIIDNYMYSMTGFNYYLTKK